jgi:16S rRNA processing protein RimM
MVVMGRVAGAQGIRGWVKLKTYTEYEDSLTDYPVWWLGDGVQPWREIVVESFALQSKGLTAKFAGCDDRTTAEKYKGLLVAVPRDSLPQAEDGEYYWSDLIGMQVVNLEGVSLGKVKDLLETGANDVLCVTGESGEILIPFIAQAIKRVDVEGKVIHVDWAADY